MKDWQGEESYRWASLAELLDKLARGLEDRFPGEVFSLDLTATDEGLELSGEVASEAVRSAALRQLASYVGVPRIVDRLEVTGTFHPATDDDWFLAAQPAAPMPSPAPADRVAWLEPPEKPHAGPSTQDASVTRFPTLETSDPLSAGSTIAIVADLTTRPRTATAPEVVLATLAPGWGRLEVKVDLMSPVLRQLEPHQGTITVFENGESAPATFRARLTETLAEGAPVEVVAIYSHENRVLETWKTSLGHASAKAVEEVPPREPQVTIAPGVPVAPMSVIIRHETEVDQEWLWYGTAGDQSAAPSMRGHSKITGDATTFAHGLLAKCPGMSSNVFRRRMEKIGEDLWLLAPEGFRSAYLATRRELGHAFPIQLLVDDHSIPWEMMLPDLGQAGGTGADHLLFTHPIARWPMDLAGTMPKSLPRGAVVSFVPEYRYNATLHAARREGEWLASTYGALRPRATVDAFLDLLRGPSEPAKVGLVHFAGHGRTESATADAVATQIGTDGRGATKPGEDGLLMEDGWVSTHDLSRGATRLGGRDHPIVILNACEAANTGVGLGWVEGWGPILAERGFGAIVAPLWRVQDEAAHDVVVEALNRLLGSRDTIGAAFTAGRALVANRSVAAFAFMTYADVTARITDG